MPQARPPALRPPALRLRARLRLCDFRLSLWLGLRLCDFRLGPWNAAWVDTVRATWMFTALGFCKRLANSTTGTAGSHEATSGSVDQTHPLPDAGSHAAGSAAPALPRVLCSARQFLLWGRTTRSLPAYSYTASRRRRLAQRRLYCCGLRSDPCDTLCG